MALTPRESAKFIAESADHVTINSKAIHYLAEQLYDELKSGHLATSVDPHTMHPQNDAVSAARWIFLVDSLNFSFWTDEDQYNVTVEGKTYTGYMALCAVINRSMKEGTNLLDADVLVNLTLESLRYLFRSDNSVEMPLLETRLHILHSHARTLLESYSGCFTNLIKFCKFSAATLLDLVCEKFISFDDTAFYKNVKVTFRKRAQILVADLWLALEGKSLGYFEDINLLTAFADYRVPQVLFFFDVLHYSPYLEKKVQDKALLENGSPLEVEIRGTCLHAVELLVQETQALIESHGDTTTLCNAVLADQFLWCYRRKHSILVEEKIQMHRTRCIYY